MGRKRGNGEGTIFQRKRDGRWVAELNIGVAEGRRKTIRKMAKRQKVVADWLNERLVEQKKGLLVEPSKETVAQFLERWLRDSVKISTRSRTYESYASTVRCHVAPTLGGIPLRKLTPTDVQRLYGQKLESGLSPRSVQYIHAVLHGALKQAVQRGLIYRNPCEAVARPKVERKTMKALDLEQVNRLLAEAQHDRLYALYILAVHTGMRRGELLGLTWDNVDLKNRRVHVVQQLQHLDKGEAKLVPPKTAKARRGIDLTSFEVKALMQHRREQSKERLRLGEAWQNNMNLVFTTGIGTPLNPANLVRRSFHPLLEKAGLPRIRFHDLRHSAASLMLQMDISAKVVQEMLGHSQISLTLDTYSHVLPSMRRDTVAKREALATRGRAK